MRFPFDAVHLLPARGETRSNLGAAAQAAGVPLVSCDPFFDMDIGPAAKLRYARSLEPATASLGRRTLIVAEDPLFAATGGRRLRRLLRRRGCDARLVVYLGWDAHHEHLVNHGPLVGRASNALTRRNLLAADGLVMVSQWTHDRYRDWLGDRLDMPIARFSHGIARTFLDPPPRRRARKRLDRFVTVTNFDYEEKTQGLLPVAEGLARLEAPFSWRILGQGRYRESIRSDIENLLGDRVTFEGQMRHRDVVAMLDEADLFLYGSHLDAMPRAVLEALSRRLPALVVGQTGALEPVEATGAGLVVQATGDAVAEAITGLRDDGAAWKALQARARAIDPAQFSWTGYLENLADLWPRMGGPHGQG